MTARQKRVLQAIMELELANPKNEITPRGLWELARAKDHPLHGEFEWDDTIAADAYRDEQARHLLRLRISVVHEERIIDAPICVRSPEAESGDSSYTRTTRIASDADRSRQVLQEELRRAMAAVERARLVAAALGLLTECDALISQLSQLRNKAA